MFLIYKEEERVWFIPLQMDKKEKKMKQTWKLNSCC